MTGFIYDRGEALPGDFYRRDTALVARELLGKVLVHNSPQGLTAGIILETEAYTSDDPSCHAFRGVTPRNRAMFGPPGCAYIYFTYGMHYCFNVVTAPEGVGEAVLLRSLEPLAGLAVMKERRGREKLTELCSGPGKLVQAMGIEPGMYGHDLTREPLLILRAGPVPGEDVVVTARVGIKLSADLPLRFYIKGNRYISRK
ncbi:MAG: DNA-3-methyladenine glycosylase [Desulfocucumaceae bacterium]